MSNPAPGWYPDPAAEDSIRYWDGDAWTDQVRPKPGALPPGPPSMGTPASDPWVQPAEQGPTAAPGAPVGGYPGQPQYGMAPAAPLHNVTGRIGPDGQVLSGWWRRVFGYILDSIIIGLPTGLVAAITIVALGGVDSLFNQSAFEDLVDRIEANEAATLGPDELLGLAGSSFWTVVIVTIVTSLVLSILNGVVLVARSGQTLGDRVVNVRKVMAGRRVPTFGVAFFRWLIPNAVSFLGNLIPFGSLLLLLDYLWPLWDSQSQTIHDKIVKTYVERSDLAGDPIK